MEPNYKELYFELFRATERAIRILIDAQQRCEETYLSVEAFGDEQTTPEPPM